MAGGIASAFWGMPQDIAAMAIRLLPPDMIDIVNRVDGSAWEPSGITPPVTLRWKKTDVVVYGTDANETMGEKGFNDTHESRFCRHPNTGFPIHIIGTDWDQVQKDIELLKERVMSNPDERYLINGLGIQKAGYSIPEMAQLFAWAKNNGRILLPESFRRELDARSE